MKGKIRELKFRVPNECQNGHFRWLFSTFTNGFENKTEWGQKHPKCKCPTHNIGEGFRPCGEPQQFIRLSDKSGAEVYEGDILQWRVSQKDEFSEHVNIILDHLLEVRWGHSGWVLFSRLFKKIGYSNGDTCNEMHTFNYIRQSLVVGNVYENHELVN